MQEAVQKLQTEMDANKNNPYIQLIGKFLIEHVQANPTSAEKILIEDKTIAKSIDAMKAEAKKKQHNGMAMLTDQEGFAIVLKYFGVEGEAPTLQITPAASDFEVSLDDFLR